MWAEIPTRNWVLSDPPSHKVGYAWQHSIIKWKWYIQEGAEEALKTQVSYMKKWPICSYPFSPSLNLWPQRECPTTSWQRKRSRFTNGSAWYAGTTPKWTVAVLQPFSGTSLKDVGKRKLFQGQPVYGKCWVLKLPAAETNTGPPHMVPFPWVNKVITLDHFYHGRGSVLFLLE